MARSFSMLLACGLVMFSILAGSGSAQVLKDLLNQITGQLPNLPGIDWQSLVNTVSQTQVYQGPTRLVVPTRYTFDMDCNQVTSSIAQSTVFRSVIRGVVAERLGVTADKLNVTGVACTVDGVTLDMDVLVPSNVSESEVQRVVQQVTTNATNLLPQDLLTSLNIDSFNVTSPIALDKIPAVGDPRQYLPPLPTIPSIPAFWDDATSLISSIFNGSTRVQLPVQLKLPSSCNAIAPSEQDLKTYKQEVQKAVAQTLNVDISRVNITKVNCSSAESALIDLRVLVDQTTSSNDMSSIFIRAKGIVTSLPSNFTSKYYNLPNVTAGLNVGFTWSQDFIKQLTKPAEAFTGTVERVIPARVTFDADCSQVVSSTQSSDQFKAAVQFAASYGLSLPLDRVSISNISCGSVIADLNVIKDPSIDPATITNAVTQITTNPSSVFPPDFRQLIGATNVSGLVNFPPGVAFPPFPPFQFPAPPKPGSADVSRAGLLMTTLGAVLAFVAALVM